MNKQKMKITIVTIIICILIGTICGKQYTIIQLETKLTEAEKKLEYLDYREMELDPCVMCGKEVKMSLLDTREVYSIECDAYDGCGLRTGFYDSANELAEIWNNIK